MAVFALQRGYSVDLLGLSARAVRAGLRLRAVVSGLIAVGVIVIAVVPFGRSFLEDDRFSELSGWSAMYQLVIRIPLVTALSEELMFRSVLLAVLPARVSASWAVEWLYVVFGLRHVLSTLGDLGGNAATGSIGADERAGSVAGVVLATTIAGLIFARTRLRSESLVAPWMTHVAFNGRRSLPASWLQPESWVGPVVALRSRWHDPGWRTIRRTRVQPLDRSRPRLLRGMCGSLRAGSCAGWRTA